VVRRPSVPLTADDDLLLTAARSDPAFREELARLSGEDVAAGEVSEAAVLHALLLVGQRAVQERRDEAGYAAIAEQLQRESEERRVEARRRRPSWAAED
jgi:hypothetical protein